MVAIKKKWTTLPDGTIDIQKWINDLQNSFPEAKTELLEKAFKFAETSAKGLTTFYGQSCLEQGLEMAATMLELNLDSESVAAALLLSSIRTASVPQPLIEKELGSPIATLVLNVLQMNSLDSLIKTKARDQIQIDRLRKMFLAMISDIRVIIIKLVERISLMRGIKNINPNERKRFAEETMELYAPLANRLGIGQLKWELEDLAFHYIDSETYKYIAKFLMDRRTDRERTIHDIIEKLKENIGKIPLTAEITGRAKHIYSVFLKMQRKHLTLKNIYDYSAIRILVPTVEDCYKALSVVHDLWEHIPEEFDDYIASPKSNGYKSIHTAVINHEGKNMEIQIRTFDMHEEAEHGIAAHWIYKENKAPAGYETKVTFLRQLLEWHKEIAKNPDVNQKINQQLFENNIYVFTPTGEILDLPYGATPLDFAYHIHTEVGHRCRGAKVNGHIVPLTYHLQTGERVEILTTKKGGPSRDWLNKETGYLNTSRSRSKVAQWFRQQEIDQYIEAGKTSLEKEFDKSNVHPNLQKLAHHFNLKDDAALFAAVGHGMIKPSHVLQAAQLESQQHSQSGIPVSAPLKKINTHLESTISGVDNLLTRIARCCKPIPNEPIIGYITQGRGVSVHRKNCPNVLHSPVNKTHRFLEISWEDQQIAHYYVELQIRAFGKDELLREITSVLSNLKIDLVSLNSHINKKTSHNTINIMVQIQNLEQLKTLLNQLQHLPNILEIKRIRE